MDLCPSYTGGGEAGQARPPTLSLNPLWLASLLISEWLHGTCTHPPLARWPAPDVLILDQHLDYQGAIVYGTDVARRLRCAGYAGFICVRSANATEEDEAEYRRCGAAWGVVSPDPRLMNGIAKQWPFPHTATKHITRDMM